MRLTDDISVAVLSLISHCSDILLWQLLLIEHNVAGYWGQINLLIAIKFSYQIDVDSPQLLCMIKVIESLVCTDVACKIAYTVW